MLWLKLSVLPDGVSHNAVERRNVVTCVYAAGSLPFHFHLPSCVHWSRGVVFSRVMATDAPARLSSRTPDTCQTHGAAVADMTSAAHVWGITWAQVAPTTTSWQTTVTVGAVAWWTYPDHVTLCVWGWGAYTDHVIMSLCGMWPRTSKTIKTLVIIQRADIYKHNKSIHNG